jgi:hypothetical protein
MTSAKFRFLIILSVLCPLASAFAGMYAAELDISLRLKSAFDAEPTPLAMLPLWQSAALGIAMTVLAVVSTLGLYAFRHWGRVLGLWSMVLFMPMFWMTGPIMQTPLENALGMTSSMLYGAVLALAYWSPICTRFEADKSRQTAFRTRSAPAPAPPADAHPPS